MNKSLTLHIKQGGKVRKCIAKIIEKEAPSYVQGYQKFYCEKKGVNFTPVMEKWIIYDYIEGHYTIADLEKIVGVFFLMATSKTDKELAEFVVDYYNNYSGPIIKKKEISLEEIKNHLYTFWLTQMLFVATVKQDELKWKLLNQLYDSIRFGQECYPEHKGEWIPSRYIDNYPTMPIFHPKHNSNDDDTFIFTVKAPPSSVAKDRDKLFTWAKNELIKNINLLITKKVKYEVRFDKTGRPCIGLYPDDIYTTALLNIINDVQKTRNCDCGCGRPAVINSKGKAWFDKNCSRKSNDKQSVLTTFRRRQTLNGNKRITSEEYQFIKRTIDKYKNLEKHEMLKRVDLDLENKRQGEPKKRAKGNPKKDVKKEE